MAFNGTGTFNRLYNWATDKVNNVKILASRMDGEMDGFATGLSNCITKDGQSTTSARITFAQGARLQNNSLVDPGAGLYITPTGGATSRDLSVILGETISPKAFGAVGDGVTDDTAALQLWVARLNAVGGYGYVPPGTYVCTQRLVFTGRAIRIEGDGANTTMFRFTGSVADNKGLLYLPDSGGSSYGGFAVRNLSIQTTTTTGVAIHIILPNDGLFSTNTAVFIENVTIEAPISGYFATGVRLFNTSNSTLLNVRYIGSATNATAESGYYGGVGFQIDSQTTSTSPSLGFSVENRIICCTANFCQYGVSIGGYATAINILGSNFQFVRRGVTATVFGATPLALICVTNCHINATDHGIMFSGYKRCHVNGCQILRPDTSANASFNGTNWFGVLLSNSSETTVSNNLIAAELATAAAGGCYGVYMDLGTTRATVDSNTFVGGGSNSLDAGVLMDATTVSCKVTDSNIYQLATLTVSDAGTNNNLLGFHFATPIAKQTVTGAHGGNAALVDLLTKLANLGLLTDSTTP